jgi:hypothetical protein
MYNGRIGRSVELGVAGLERVNYPSRMSEAGAMQNWKKAVVIGSLTAGALLAIKGKRSAAVILGTTGLAVLAAEYPEKFESVWEHAPEYVSRGAQIFAVLSKLSERLADEAARRGLPSVWHHDGEYARY